MCAHRRWAIKLCHQFFLKIKNANNDKDLQTLCSCKFFVRMSMWTSNHLKINKSLPSKKNCFAFHLDFLVPQYCACVNRYCVSASTSSFQSSRDMRFPLLWTVAAFFDLHVSIWNLQTAMTTIPLIADDEPTNYKYQQIFGLSRNIEIDWLISLLTFFNPFGK